MEAYIDLIQQEERERYGPSYIPPSQEMPAGPRSALSPPPIPEITKPTTSTPPQDPIDLTYDNTSYEQPWTCPTCTLENPANFLCCDACASERPRPSATRPPTAGPSSTDSRNKKKRPISQSASRTVRMDRTRAVETLAALDSSIAKRPLGWICQTCGTFMETEYWTCSNCGMMKQNS
jgi:hypothetical protein